MLRVLLASQPVRAGWLGGTAFSTVTHGALIALAVVATNKVATAVREERAAAPVEHITYVEPAKLAEAMRAKKAAVVRKSAAKPAAKAAEESFSAPQIAMAQFEIPDVTAAPDLTSVTDAWLNAPDSLTSAGANLTELLRKRAGFTPPANGVYSADMVDRAIEPRRGNPKPKYPSSLANAGIEGDFMVRFVVDSTGAVPDDKIEFPSTMHRLFAAAVRTALLRSRYYPAKSGGRVVAQQVIQEFRFKIGNR